LLLTATITSSKLTKSGKTVMNVSAELLSAPGGKL
jgi:hypothetical protein